MVKKAAERRTAVLLDPHPLWLDALEQALGDVGVETVGRLTSPREALALIESVNPTLLLVDPDARDGEFDGLDCIREANARFGPLPVIAISGSTDPDRIEAAFAAGALGYFLKTSGREDLVTAVCQVFDHSLSFGSGRGAAVTPRAAASATDALSPRELEILRLVAEGRSNRQVAKQLWVTEQTVKFHLVNIFRKLGVQNRTEAGRWAHTRGLLPRQTGAGLAQPLSD
jgi:DNA-binding NarL/FixJ family response regulator